MNSILGICSMLLDDNLEEEQRKMDLTAQCERRGSACDAEWLVGGG